MAAPSQERFEEIDRELAALDSAATSAEGLLERVRSEVRKLDGVDVELGQLAEGVSNVEPRKVVAPTDTASAREVESPATTEGDPFTSSSGETVAADPFPTVEEAAPSGPPEGRSPAATSVETTGLDVTAEESASEESDLDLEFPPPRPSVVPVTGMRADVLNAELDAAIPISVEEEAAVVATDADLSHDDPSERPMAASAPPPLPPSRPAPRPPAPIAGARPWPPPESTDELVASSVKITELDEDNIEILDDDDLEMIAEPVDGDAAAAASSYPPGTDPDDDAETRGFFKKLFGE